MERIHANSNSGRAAVKKIAEEIEKQLVLLQLSIEMQALDLRDAFREERERLQKLAQAEADRTTPVGRRRPSLYAPLNLFARGRFKALEIYWQEVHIHGPRKTRKHVYLRRNADGNYSVQRLLLKAQPFEVELVAEAEKKAQELRALWRDCSQVRRALQNIDRRTSALEPPELAPEGVATTPGGFDLVPSRPAYE